MCMLLVLLAVTASVLMAASQEYMPFASTYGDELYKSGDWKTCGSTLFCPQMLNGDQMMLPGNAGKGYNRCCWVKGDDETSRKARLLKGHFTCVNPLPNDFRDELQL